MDKQKVIIVLLVLNLIVMLYFGNSLGKKINNYEVQTNEIMNSIQNNMISLENGIINGVGNELRAQADKIARVDYTLIDVDPVQKKAQIGIVITLKEVSPLAEISISYSAQDDEESKEAVLVNQSGLIYGSKLEMSLDHNYRFDVWEKSASTGQKKLNVSEQLLPLFDDIYANRVTMNGSGTGISQDQLDVDFSFSIKDLGFTGMEMEQVLMQILKDNEQYDEIDVTGQIEQHAGNYAQIENKYKVSIAAGQIDQSVTLEQFAIDNGYEPEQGEQDVNLQYSYKHHIVLANDYPELKLDAASAKQLSFKLIIKFKDGYTYTM
ncbi:hypothetical protein [Paenibacillus endoradicis]|uniref:hypothetical protein n=1 Tax=Paenibacillus endoradicis TaxID=2972487 RepID=UPI0021596BA3|nr:hypothetical protein [Paenibacillus endoradicis]MCR8659205.1 hypothetical protein [Paenibacillus endoradicis]